MAKIRSIKPSFWEDEKIGSLPVEARLLFIGTWSLADDNGVLRGSPAYLRSQIYPYDEAVTAADVRRWISALVEGGMLVPFTYKGENYLVVRHFRNHQKIDARFATELVPSAEVDAVLASFPERCVTPAAEPQSGHGGDTPRTQRDHGETTASLQRGHTENTPSPHRDHVGATPLEVEVEVYSGVGVETHTPVYTEKGGVGENTAAASDGSSASRDAVPADVVPADDAEDDDEDWYGVVEVSPAQAAEGDALNAAGDTPLFVRRAEEIRRLIGERYPRIASMQEPLRDDQLLWIARRYAMEDVRRILSDMDDKRVYDPHSRSYRTKTFNAFMAFADCDRMVGGVGRRADGAGGMAPSRPSKRLYTYEEMCDEIPSRARQEDFTMVEIGGRKLWQKRVVV